MKPRVFATRIIPEAGLKLLRERFDIDIWEGYAAPSREEIAERVEGADALISLLSDTIDSKVFDAAPKLKMVAQYAVGFDNISIEEASKRGIFVSNTPGVLTETTADFVWALLLSVARRVVEADRYVRAGEWKVGWHPKMLLGRDIHGSTLGIVGAGRIGSAVARRAAGFGMKILYTSVTGKPELEREVGAKRASLRDLLKRSDFVSVHVPLTPDTFHLIDEEKLKLMKKTAYLVNNSRGSVIDESALTLALKEEWIAGAALDVFKEEPILRDSPFLAFKNVVLAPHISSSTHQTRSRMAEMVAENLIAYFEGRIPPNLVNREVVGSGGE